MKKRRIIALVFNGEEPNLIVLASLSKVLETACLVEGNVEGYTYDEKDVVNLIAKSLNTKVFKNLPREESQYRCETPEDNAAVFIGGLMKKELGKDYQKTHFVANLIDRIRKAKKHPTNELNKEFWKALCILSGDELNISKTILEEYNLDLEKLSIISDTFRFMTKYE